LLRQSKTFIERCQNLRVRSNLRENNLSAVDPEAGEKGPPDTARWYEKGDRYILLHLAPLDTGAALQRAVGSGKRAWGIYKNLARKSIPLGVGCSMLQFK